MKYLKFSAVVILLTAVFVLTFDKKSFSWSLFNLYSDAEYSEEQLEKVLNFNPDEDVLFLPKLEGKDFFTACDDLSICREPEVRKYLYVYLTKGRPYVIKAIENSNIYLPEIEKKFDENPDMPKDIMMLPLLESAFNPKAVSRTKAMGMWQFVKNTSKMLGLQNNRWMDERRNVEKSTDAAIRHIRYLHKALGSWDLVLAAYNGGAGHVKRSMEKQNETDFWTLVNTRSFREETNQYVPRFAALLVIYKHQKMFGIDKEIEKNDSLKYEDIELKNPVSLNEIARISGCKVKDIRELNPELKRNITPPHIKNYTLRLPSEAAEIVKKEKKNYITSNINI